MMREKMNSTGSWSIFWRGLSRRLASCWCTLVCGAGLFVSWSAVRADSGLEHPNILLIITDQQQADMMSVAGDHFIKTPALDRLAARGVRFERAYATNPVCVPSRVSMMTGHMPSYFGMRSNDDHGNQAPPDDLKRALGWSFRNQGYDTVYAGKTHWLRGMTPQSIGFERLTADERDGLSKQCVQYLNTAHEKPFFLVASFINPHDICYMAIDDYARANHQPLMYPQSLVERQRMAQAMQFPEGVSESQFYRELAPPLPDNYEIPIGEPDGVTLDYVGHWGFLHYARTQYDDKRWRLHRWAYRRLMEMVDAQIGAVLDALHQTGLSDSTIVVFTSDHGEMNGAHRLEHKSIPYEEAARVPLIIAGPEVAGGGRVDRQHLISVGLDLLPTLCDLARIATPTGLLGRSVRPLAENRPDVPWRDEVVVESRAARMVRTDRYKYVIYASGTHREQLTDLRNDPGEMKNLAEDPHYRHVLNEHRGRLSRWVAKANDKFGRQYVRDAD